MFLYILNIFIFYIKIKLLVSILIIILIIINSISFAGVAVNGSSKYVNISADNMFLACLYMRNGGTSTLGANQLDPHLSTALDDGAYGYLSASMYGSMSSNSQIRITSDNSATALGNDGKSTYTTTGNASGIEYMGNNYTYSSAMINGGNAGDYNKIIKSYLDKNSKYITKLPETNTVETTRGMALAETLGWFSGMAGYTQVNMPILQRYGFALSYYRNNGYPGSNVTFRPAIWNINAN